MTRRSPSKQQLPLPGLRRFDAAPVPVEGEGRIAHRKILEAHASAGGGRGVEDVYRQEVLPVKTRTLQLLGRKSSAAILHTLLGYEVKAGFKRIHCPDMVTARYLKLFTELGCRTIKLPYDPTVTARIVPELEAAFDRLRAGIRQLFPGDRRTELYVTRRVFHLLRGRLR